jgi:hypothetical protein
MNLHAFLISLESHPTLELRFQLPDGGRIPAHAHITEVGRLDRTFLDCGGTQRQHSCCLLQTWIADDIEHRLSAGKLAGILQRAAPILGDQELPVDVEYEDGVTAQFRITASRIEEGTRVFELANKPTDCLAKEICLPTPSGCQPGSGCC